MSLADRLGRCLGRWLGTGIEQRLAARHLADAARATGAVARAARGPATRGADNKVGRPRGSESEHLPVSLADLGIAAPRLHEARIIRDTYTDDDRGASPPVTAVVVGSALERAHLARALADHVGRHGRDHVPESLAALSDALSRQSPPDAATAIDSLDGDAESGLVTYTDAAGMLGISARTVSRRVADGQLDTVGRRITRSSLEALSKGRR